MEELNFWSKWYYTGKLNLSIWVFLYTKLRDQCSIHVFGLSFKLKFLNIKVPSWSCLHYFLDVELMQYSYKNKITTHKPQIEWLHNTSHFHLFLYIYFCKILSFYHLILLWSPRIADHFPRGETRGSWL